MPTKARKLKIKRQLDKAHVQVHMDIFCQSSKLESLPSFFLILQKTFW